MQNTVEKSVRSIEHTKYSVLMPVYVKENPVYFRQAVESMMKQTAAPDEFVLVCDGPLNNALEAVIKIMTERWPDIVKIVRLPECGGHSRLVWKHVGMSGSPVWTAMILPVRNGAKSS